LLDRSHFKQAHLRAGPRRLPRGFNSRQPATDNVNFSHFSGDSSLLLAFCSTFRRSRLRTLFFTLLLDLPMSRGRDLRDSLGLRQPLATTPLLTRMLLLSHLALMFLVLKFVYRISCANLGHIQVSHLLSAHIVYVLPFVIRLLDTQKRAFV
jgi:hypothetical protein